MSPASVARQFIDSAHAADPEQLELSYADSMERWLLRVNPSAEPLLRLAARCQHLERWTVPRTSYPMDKAGYHAWRRGLYIRQAERASALLQQAGYSTAETAAVFTWVSKTDLHSNPGSQALEDAACLVFFEGEIAGFASAHPDYTREKFIDIIRKSWKKMSPAAHTLALTIPLPPAISDLVQAALSPA